MVIGGPGNTGITGVLVKNMPSQAIAGSAVLAGVVAPGAQAGDAVDVMTHGEIVDIVGLVAGTVYYAHDVTGVLVASVAGAVPANTTVRVGFTVEATRLVVRIGK